MSDTAIEWTDVVWTDQTRIVDRGGRRVRTYQRRDPSRPGQQERRARLALGHKWCRGCSDWLPSDSVAAGGMCRSCKNADYRVRYAADGQQIRARVHARKRALAPLPREAAEALTVDFCGTCAYCAAPGTTWDHVIPVAAGGQTTPANVVPACQPCNSSKGTQDVWDWMERTGRLPSDSLVDLLSLATWAGVA